MDIFTSLTAEEIAHSKRTAEISRILAEHADYDSAEVHEVYQAALLHDIGKTMIPVRIRQLDIFCCYKPERCWGHLLLWPCSTMNGWTAAAIWGCKMLKFTLMQK